MKVFYIVLIAVGALLLLMLLAGVFVKMRMRRAAGKVKNLAVQEKIQMLNGVLEPFGFGYDERNDAICSEMYTWQRDLGYCRAYDEAAPLLSMVFDCEPVYFDYGGNRYLLEVWKGQYGCTTGAEIGIYVNRDADKDTLPDKLVYESVQDEERLPMRFALYRGGKLILERNELHWWLTGFWVGMYSEPEELVMEVGIGFPNRKMCNAFCEGLLRVGYATDAIHVENSRVYFRFDRPFSKQQECNRSCRKRVMRRNRKNCRLYSRITREFDTTLDKVSYIGYCFPILYRVIFKIGSKGSRKKLEKYRKKMNRAKA